MTDTNELRTEGKIAIKSNLRIGYYCVEAANEIERLRAIVRVNGLRWGHTHAEIDALLEK